MSSVSRSARLRCSFLAAALFCLGATAVAQDILKNEHIVEMKKAGMEDSTVLTLIQSRSSSFDTTVRALVALKEAGVSDVVINAIIAAGRTNAAGANGLFDMPEEIGVYVNQREQLVPLKTELVTWRTGGELKKLYGNRGHLNGVVSKPWSTLHVDAKPEFILRVPDGVAAEEYQLLRFWKKGNRREFRIVTGGVLHADSGPDDNLVSVEVERLGSRMYRVWPSLPLQSGEYGFLAPAAAATASAASSGKIYTFRVDQQR
jgi:hypothetical protein